MAMTLAAQQNGGKSAKDRLIEGEMILADKAMGMRVSDLMAKYGYSKVTIHKRLNDALAARIATTVDDYREQQNALLDDLAMKWGGQVNAAEQMMDQALNQGDLGALAKAVTIRENAMNGILRVAERRARLNGLDAPVKVQATVVEVTQADLEIQEMVSEARARAAAVGSTVG